jgi:gluconokinase
MMIILMGVSGSGKTTIGKLLAEELAWTFYDADDFHPQANVEKMQSGQPLNDEDRIPWLERLRQLLRDAGKSKTNVVLACSALKARYREYLLIDENVRLVYLKGDAALIQQRMQQRQNHFMKAAMLASQFAALEEPEQAVVVDVSPSPTEIVQNIRKKLGI